VQANARVTMPKKGSKKKAKGPEFETNDDVCRPFGFAANDVIVTPLGIEVTIIGVKVPPAPPPPEGDDGEPPADGYAHKTESTHYFW